MNSRELANEVWAISSEATSGEWDKQEAQVISDAQDRIMGVGREQYSQGDMQKFELMPLDHLLEYFEEELLDQINYAVMNTIRIRRIRQVLRERLGADVTDAPAN
jgi:hypothetical protein